MRLIQLSLLLAAAPILLPATTVSYTDPFGAAASSCNSSSCDVIGDRLWFDFEKFSMTVDPEAMTGTIALSFNFGPNDTLAPFDYGGIRLSAADVLFTVNGSVRYGVALTGHGGTLEAGHLYRVNSGAGVLTAFDVLQLGSDYAYRPGFAVWLNDDGHGSISQAGAGSITTQVTGDGLTAGRLTVAIQFAPDADFIAALQSGAFGAQFASATCGNDIMSIGVQSAFAPTPEPAAAMLAAAGLACLAVTNYRRRRRQSVASCDPERR